MIPRITKARQVNDSMWMVWLAVERWSDPVIRLVPVTDTPKTCPGGLWCETIHPNEPY